jgi:hypothetical protein
VYKALSLIGLLLAFSAISVAQDPRILICGSSCDPPTVIPIYNEASIQALQPNGSGQVDDTFVNLTGTIIDNFAFDMTVNTGLVESLASVHETVQQAFTCGDLLGFFMNCTVTYNDATGNLLYQYSGVNPPETGLAGILDSVDNEVNEQEGIPPCTLGYLVCEYLENGRGIFTIELDGWTSSASFDGVSLYKGNAPVFTNSFNVPEPSAVLIFLTEMLLFVAVLAIFGRRLHLKRFDL